MNLGWVFLTGLTTGALTCLAMQGGLLTGVIANQKAADRKNQGLTNRLDKNDWLPVSLFLGSKLAAHTILGFFLGALGSMIVLSLEVKVAFQIFTALFMLATAMNLLNVHPIFRYVLLQPPKFIQKKIRRTTKDGSWFAPVTLGLLTIFIPCGVTQAMEVLAINSGSPLEGAMIMFAFVLGTVPLFSLIGLLTSRLSEVWQTKFLKVAAISLIVMAIYILNGALVVMNAPVSWQKTLATYQKLRQYESGSTSASANDDLVKVNQNKQAVTIAIQARGYVPDYFKVKRGIPVELTLETNEVYSCASAFVFREFGIRTMLKPTDRQTFSFTPTKPGKFIYSCSMGMYSGVMEVI